MKTKHEMREAAIGRLRYALKHQPRGPLCADDVTEAIVGDGWVESSVDEDAEFIIDLLTDDEPSCEDDAYTMGPRDADGIFWFRGDMSDSPWGVIEGVVYDCTRREWLVRGHDISAPWMSADSIRHAPMRTATQQEDVCRCHNCIATKRNNDLIELLKDAARDYKAHVELWHGFASEQAKYIDRQTIALPRDADGAPVHLWDKVTYHGMCEQHRGKVFEVRGYGSIGGSLNAVVVYDTKLVMLAARDCKHYNKPTVEDVLREFAIACEDTGNAGPEVQRLAGEYAKKLQLKEEVDED